MTWPAASAASNNVRGANMGVMEISHPDCEEFITVKRTPGVLENFNLSVAVDDRFMEAVEKDGTYDLINPRTGKVVKTIKARDLFDLIVESAWASGEPGVLFIDTINRYNPLPELGRIEGTNPCLVGETRILTPNGEFKIEDLARAGLDVMVYAYDPSSDSIVAKFGRSPRKTREQADVVRVNFDDGSSVAATPDHRFWVVDGEEGEWNAGHWVEAGKLAPGMWVANMSDGANAVVSVEPAGKADVYNITVDDCHNYFANGMLVANCGEQPLLPYQSCVLGSINLSKFVKKDSGPKVDTARLEEAVRNAVRFLNGIIDVTEFPLKEIEEMTRATRPIGLGVMGFADMLVMLGIPYDSEKAVKTAEEVMKFINDTAWDESRRLAKTRGPFPAWKKSIFKDDPEPPRNCSVTTVAPTGSISMIADCSSGIEPIFAVAYTKTVLDGTPFRYVNKYFEQIAKERGFWSEALAEEVARTGSVQHIKEVPDDVKALFKTAQEISPERHVGMQAAFQKHVTSSISKTINMPASATKEDVAKIYMLAWKLGCKGITVYRDGCRGVQVLTTGAEPASANQKQDNTAQEAKACSVVYTRPRARITSGTTEKVKIGCGSLFVTVNSDDVGLCEVFTATGKYGGCASQSQATSRLISLALRSGISPEAVVEELKDIRCPACLTRKGVNVKSCPDAIARAIERHLNSRDEIEPANGIGDDEESHTGVAEKHSGNSDARCPECGKPLSFAEGCQTCKHCGYSKCS